MDNKTAQALPIVVFIGGERVDIDSVNYDGSDINVYLDHPVFFSDTGERGFIDKTDPGKMGQ